MNRKSLVGFVLLAVIVVGVACTPGSTTPRPVSITPTQVAVVTVDASVRRATPEVWAGSGSPLPKLSDFDWHPLAAGGMVTTDANGEGWVQIDECLRIYVFFDTQLVRSPCRKSERLSGSATCTVQGTSAYNNTCGSEVIVQTPSVNLVLSGTWAAVTYLPEWQLSLVVVSEGVVTATPLQDESRLGEPKRVRPQQFLFTAPDAFLDRVSRLTDLPPREPVPVEGNLSVFARTFELQPWMDRIVTRATKDKKLLALSAEALQRTRDIGVQGVGGAFSDPRVEQALTLGVAWGRWAEALFSGEENVGIQYVREDGTALDLITVQPDPEKAFGLLEEAGYANGFAVTVVYVEDEALAKLVSLLVEEDLPGLNIKVERVVSVSSREEALAVQRKLAEGQQAVLTLWYR